MNLAPTKGKVINTITLFIVLILILLFILFIRNYSCNLRQVFCPLSAEKPADTYHPQKIDAGWIVQARSVPGSCEQVCSDEEYNAAVKQVWINRIVNFIIALGIVAGISIFFYLIASLFQSKK